MKILINSFALTGWHLHEIMKCWSKTQNLDLFSQLEAGVRFLDLRIGVSETDNIWRIHHGIIYGEALGISLRMVQDFLIQNPTEIVVIGVSHVENFSLKDLNHLILTLNIIFKNTIYKYHTLRTYVVPVS